MSIKLIATDMDGTLLNDRKQVPTGFTDWVKSHPELLVVIASGRQYYRLYQDFAEVADRLIFIADNGGFIFEKGRIVYSNPMATDSVLACLEQLRDVPGMIPIVCGAESAYMRHADPELEAQAAKYYARIRFVDDVAEWAAKDRIAKVALYIRDGRAQERNAEFHCAQPGLTHTVSGVEWIDISNVGINKGTAIREIQRQHGLRPEECMAFGDFMNDYELLQNCTESYAMDNACDGIKAIAKHRAPSNNDAGVMQILQKMFP